MRADLCRKMLIVSAPSGSGKSTLIGALLQKNPNLAFSISATTRPPRGKEEHGKDYFFLSVEDFKEKIKQNAFVEWEEVYEGRFYGTLKSELERLWGMGKTVVFDIDVKGGLNLKKMYPKESLSVFIKAPSLENLRERLIKRGTDSPEQIEQRLAKAKEETSHESYFDHVLINDDLSKSQLEFFEIVETFLQKKESQ
ncbi:MAG: guanylate kinase [Flavobacteriaceae bacterium]|nr:MAG: guanylate kinase [Flavobacteriaceae bacterium]